MTDTAAWAALLRVHARLVPQLDRELRERCDLPLTWYDVLLELDSAPGRSLTMGRLGEAVVVSRTRVTRVVDDLVRAGLVERQTHPDDRRSTVVAITAEGRRRFRRAAPVYMRGIERHFTRHLGADAATVAQALKRVLEA
jgi:DNA-binding MarR family transcriptional regulator